MAIYQFVELNQVINATDVVAKLAEFGQEVIDGQTVNYGWECSQPMPPVGGTMGVFATSFFGPEGQDILLRRISEGHFKVVECSF